MQRRAWHIMIYLTNNHIGHPVITFAQQLQQGSPGQRAPDLQPLRYHSGCDELVVGNFFVQFVIGGLVEEDQVVQLVPHLSFGPLLLRTKSASEQKWYVLKLHYVMCQHSSHTP